MSDFRGSRLVAKFVELCMERMEIINDSLLKLVGDPENEAATTAMFVELEALKGESNMLNLMSFHALVGQFEAVMKWGEQEQFDVHPQFFELAFSGLEAISQLVYAGIYDASDEIKDAAEAFSAEGSRWLENPLRPEPTEPEPEPEPEVPPQPEPSTVENSPDALDPMRLRLMELFGALCEKRIGAVREYLVTLQSMPRPELVPLALREVESIRSEAQILGLTPISDVAAHIGMLMLWLSARHFQGPGQAFDGLWVGLDLLQERITAGFQDGPSEITEDIEEYQQGVTEWLQENESVPIPESPIWAGQNEIPPVDDDTEEVMPEWVSATPDDQEGVRSTEPPEVRDNDEMVDGPFVVDWPMGFMDSSDGMELSEEPPVEEPLEGGSEEPVEGDPEDAALFEPEAAEVIEIQFSEDGLRVESPMTEELPTAFSTEERFPEEVSVQPKNAPILEEPPVISTEPELSAPEPVLSSPEPELSGTEPSTVDTEPVALQAESPGSAIDVDEEISFMAESVLDSNPPPSNEPAYWSVAVEQLDDLTRIGGTLGVQQSQNDQGLQALHRISGTWSRGLQTLRDAVGPQGDAAGSEHLSGVVDQLSGAHHALGIQLDKMGEEALVGRSRLRDLQSEIQQIHGLEADAWFQKHPESRFAWDQLLIVEIAGSAYGLSVHRIQEVVEVRAEQLHADSVSLPDLGQTVPLMNLSETMGWSGARESLSGSVVLLNSENRCWALQVDRVVGQRKAVQQVANPMVSGFPFVSGTAIVDEGRVVTCLGVRELIELASANRQRMEPQEPLQ